MDSFAHAAASAPPLPPPHCCRYETLATLSLTPVAVQAIRDKGGVELTNDWLSYNMGKVQHLAASTAALQMLARIGAQDHDTFSALIDDGKIETVCSSMYACETITPKFVAGFEALIEVSVTERPTFAAEFVHNGRMRQLVELYGGDDNRAEMLCTDPASALGFIELAVQMGQHGELKGLMQDEGVPQVRRSRFMLLSLVVYVRVLFVPFLSFPFLSISLCLESYALLAMVVVILSIYQLVMLLMGQHPNHEMLMEAGNEALQLLLDPRTALVAALDKLEFQLEQMEGGRLDEALMRNIDQSTQVLSKLIGIVEETCRIIIVYFNSIK